MKILKKGNKKIEPWIGRKFTCKRCGTIFQLEKGDAKEQSERGIEDSGGKRYYVECPNPVCKQGKYFN
jgi:rubredoxin